MIQQGSPYYWNPACPITWSYVACFDAVTTVDSNGLESFVCYNKYNAAQSDACGGSAIGATANCGGPHNFFCPPGYPQGDGNQCGTISPGVPVVDKNKGDCPVCEGNPINPLVGNKRQTEQDYKGEGSFPLVLRRVYNSFGGAPGSLVLGLSGCDPSIYNCKDWTAFVPNAGTGAYIAPDLVGNYTNVPIDVGWRLSYDRALVALRGAANIATLFRPDSKTRTFTLTSAAWLPDVGELDTKLTQQVDSSGYTLGWTYINENDETEIYGPSGKLLSITNRAGLVQTLQYDAGTGFLTSVTDAFGGQLTFSYDSTTGQLLGATDPNNGSYTYTYTSTVDGNGNLSTVTYPDTHTRQYLYENPTFTHALTGIVDENGSRYATWTYDANGYATGSQHAGGAEAVTLSYPSLTTAIATDAGGATRTYSIQVVNGIAKAGTVVETCGANCSRTRATTYDVDGNITIDDDVNGNRTCFAYDLTRDLPTGILEGLPSTKACPSTLAPNAVDAAHPERMTTTLWHPDWVLKAREAAPKKLTTWVYNGQPDPVAGGTASCVTPATALPDGKPLAVLCASYEQATTDATGGLGLSATVTGATRAWTYTYNQYGQVLTETTPKQSPTDALSHTTTYTYYPTTSFSGAVGHTMGDLNTIKNPLLQMTTLTSYDKAGRLLSSTDANSTVTSMTYWPRGWLHTQTVTPASGSPLTTTYDYWPTGLLKTVTMVDASTLNYAYDDAHRLTDITDAAGNKIHYALDNMGNRTGEQVSDASGQLASAVTRVYDQLNRVQSTTGAMH